MRRDLSQIRRRANRQVAAARCDQQREQSTGRANGSILSLVNRAVKSNIFLNNGRRRQVMLKYDEDWPRACMRCDEWEAKWQVRAELICKWCDWETRAGQAPVPAYLSEVIMLE